MSDDFRVTVNGVPVDNWRYVKMPIAQQGTPTISSQSPIPAAATFHIAVTKEDGVYMARLAYQSQATALADGLFGAGETPLEAFYDLCEVIAEWGLDGEGRDYPPSLWQRFKWWLSNLW